MISSILMRIARAILQNVLNQLNQLFQQIEEQAMNVLKAIVAQVVGGVWVGKAADAFVQEVMEIAIPGATKVQSSVGNFGSGISKAQEIMDNAEQAATNLIRSKTQGFKFL